MSRERLYCVGAKKCQPKMLTLIKHLLNNLFFTKTITRNQMVPPKVDGFIVIVLYKSHTTL